MKTLDQIRADLETEEGHFLKLQNQLNSQISALLSAAGYLQNRYTNISADRKAKEWVWGNQFCQIIYRRPVYHDMFSERRPPKERGRKSEEALSLTVSNKSGASIERNIQKEHSVFTNASILDSNTFTFGVEFGLEAGVKGTDANGGANFVINAKSYFGGEILKQWGSEKGEKIIRTISDKLTLEPYSEYKIYSMVDKLDLEQEIDISGKVDFEITLKLPNPGHNGGHACFNREKIKVDSTRDLIRVFLGQAQGVYKDASRLNQFLTFKDNHKVIVPAINALLNEETRVINTTTKMRYNNAGDATLTVEKIGTWKEDQEAKDGWKLLNSEGKEIKLEK